MNAVTYLSVAYITVNMKFLVVLSSCLVACAFGCGDDLVGSSGTFFSPNYPSDYGNNALCDWTITVSAGEMAMVSFTAFNVESESSCNYDKVVIRDGSSSGTILATLCGATTPAAVVGSSNVLFVRLQTDSSVTRPGFQAEYSVAGDDVTRVPTPPAGGCGGNLEGSTGELVSPNYPSNYDNNVDCTWTITIPEGVISLRFADMDIESSTTCGYDSLAISDTASGTVLATLCGSSSGSVDGLSGSVTLRFKTDSSVQKKGFSLSWSRLTCASKGGECVSASDCTGDLRNELFCSAGTVCCFPRFEQGECGILPVRKALIGGKPRIVGGDEAAEHSWPWQASLQTTSSSFHFCGASIISDRWIITAAHCVEGDTPSGLKVVTGEHHQVDNSGKEVEHAVESIHMHEAYNGNGAGFPNDIALLKLRDSIGLNRERLPICLADVEDEFVGGNCFITGWGLTKGTGDDDVLNELKIDVLTQAVCRSKWGSSYINSGHICLGNGLSGACNGDSGGPLACEKTRNGVTRWVLAGATSWGRSGCQTEGFPSVYSRISYFRDWIESTIRSNN